LIVRHGGVCSCALALTRQVKVCYAEAMTFYFAYGSNMHRLAMKRRCPSARAVGPAALNGYRFFVGLDGWGSVGPSAGHIVHGGALAAHAARHCRASRL
jgi:hypothetical protein